mmetsp:Transcript_78098/g.156286  ORF Transcript_78098/g.156286 Transcript_78098/m.156286 type:complete len:481 (+) Transcript_78098:47-1489(+)
MSQQTAIRAQARARLNNDMIENNVKNVVEYEKVDQRAKWENKTTAKIETKRKGARVSELQGNHAASLLARKRQLAGILNNEMNQWQKEFGELGESPHDRKMALQSRALALRDARESERRAFVDDMYKLQWQSSCDDGRLLDSKATIKQVMVDRDTQIQHKVHAASKLQAEEGMLMAEWKQRIDELETKENQKEAYRSAMEKEIKGMLDEQVTAHHGRKEALRARQAKDASEEMHEWRAAKDQEEDEEQEKAVLARQRGIETRTFNQSRVHLRAEAAQTVKSQDLVLLNFALDKERAKEAEEAAKRLEEKETTKRYQDYLELQMVKEAEDFAEVDAVRKKAEDQIFAKREQEQQDRLDARNALWRNTDRGRQEQIRFQYERAIKEAEDDNAMSSKNGGNQDELDAIETAKRAAHKQALGENQLGIRAQVSYKQRVGRREVQEKYLEAKIMSKVEVEHKARLSEMAGTVKVNFPNKHTQWYS